MDSNLRLSAWMRFQLHYVYDDCEVKLLLIIITITHTNTLHQHLPDRCIFCKHLQHPFLNTFSEILVLHAVQLACFAGKKGKTYLNILEMTISG